MALQQLARWCNGQAQGSGDRFPAGPRALLSWFQSGRKGLGTCNRFEELNSQVVANSLFRGHSEALFLGR